MNKKFLTYCVGLVVFLLSANPLNAQNFPRENWETFESPEDAGYDSEKLAEAKVWYDSIGSASLMLIEDGKAVIAWGDYEREMIIHSVRKSFISALYGIYTDNGTIDKESTLGELGITSKYKLTEKEKSARVLDLLTARSGVYIPSGAEAPSMKKSRPERGSKEPGEFWYYNNWDFNVLGTILKNETGKNIFEALKEDIYDPIGAEDFDLSDGSFETEGGQNTEHLPYVMKMSARDMARFGWLFANQGEWNGNQVISKSWVEESTAVFTEELMDNYKGLGKYGYMWWIPNGFLSEFGAYQGAGAGGHYITVLPKTKQVLVHRVDTYINQNRVGHNNVMKLYEMVLSAKTGKSKRKPKTKKLPSVERSYESVQWEDLSQYEGTFEFPDFQASFTISKKEDKLIFNWPFSGFDFEIVGTNEEDLGVIKDMDMKVKWERNDAGEIEKMLFEYKRIGIFQGQKKG